MTDQPLRIPLCLPAQGASEIEATLIEWFVAEGDSFEKGQVLAQAESAKSVFDFEAPCAGRVLRIRHWEGETVPLVEPVMDIETTDPAMAEGVAAPDGGAEPAPVHRADLAAGIEADGEGVVLLGVGGYLPQRVVTNAELVRGFPEVTEDYVYQVTGIRERRWAADGEKPSTMALAAAREAIRKSGISARELDAVIVATTTPDVAMPSTACILHERLGLQGAAAFDLNAACSGWLYAIGVARSMILARMARTVLTVGVELQSRLLHPGDRNAYFLFGDGAGAAVLAAGNAGHRIRQVILQSNTSGLHMARREAPGFLVAEQNGKADPWIRLDGQALFRLATESFGDIIRESIARSGWSTDETRWIVPHQANGRILKAAAKRCGLPFERFYLNVQRLGNTSSASIPLSLEEAEEVFNPGDKLVLCSVGAGMTSAAVSVEW